METEKVIQQRASLKACLSPNKIDPQAITSVLEAARAAPSARNNQPTQYLVINDPKTIQFLVKEAFSEGNQVVAHAPALIFICANPQDAMVREGVNYYLFDAGLATENLLLAATDLGMATHPMTGFNEPEVKRILGIPEEVKVVAATPLSCPTQGTYEEAAKERLAARKRKSLDEIVCWNSWGNTKR
jgi:nitroreductase